MTLHVAVLGIDGSGKSTLAAALPVVLAGEHKLVAGSSVGDDFWIRTPEQDLSGPGFHPLGTPVAARLARFFRWLAKAVVDNRALYPTAKVLQMLTQDNAAAKLAERHGVDVMVSDGNLLLTGAGRAFNYRGPDSSAATVEDVYLAFEHLLSRRPLPAESRSHLPNLRSAEILAGIARLTRMHGIWAPDVVIFLDVTPQCALSRIAMRGLERDRHENEKDLATAREGYLRVVEVTKQRIGADAVHMIDAEKMTSGEVLIAALKVLEPRLSGAGTEASRSGALHAASGSALKRILSYRYLGRYLIRRFFEDAWREPFFPLSAAGRTFLKQGYSAGVMRLIYERPSSPPLLSLPFYGYPLHEAVHDRLSILERHIEQELRRRLAAGKVCVFTGPSGFGYDLMRPLQRIKATDPKTLGRLTLVAADLDQANELRPELESVAAGLGINFEFLRGDMTGTEVRELAQRNGPYDIALFVGLSAWLPKPPTIAHLKWLRDNIKQDGVLVMDCFTPAAYAIGGMAMGYTASYYPPQVMASVLEYCGFRHPEIESGPNRINHVLIASPGPN